MMDKAILIIEDNEQDQKIMSRYLSKAGLKNLHIVDSGEKGLAEAVKISPDIILVDTMLPGMNGFETCQQLKKIEGLTSKIIMMTGQIDAVDADKAKSMGADDYCVKTSDSALVLAAINNFLGISGAEQPAPGEPGEHAPVKEKTDQWAIERDKQAVKALYKELEKKNEELKQLDKLKSEFVATVSHELRTPLTLIKGSISHILDGIYGDVQEKQREKLAMALKAANSLRRIIDNILDLSKLEAHEVKLEKKNIDLTALAKEVQEAFLPLMQERGLALKVKAEKEPVNVDADYDKIVQVLTNLVGNAFKFTEKGEIIIAIKEEGAHVGCSITDMGCGIAQEDLPKVFGKFEQFGQKKGIGQEGTGLGLSICKDIVELHKGKISVISQIDRGTTFAFVLPKN